ncbi:hypothetical protein B4W69_01180 [Staphylococcus delphini]|nr:hypothetical protein B4W69_01180 [Staphylococcus delphini]
MKGVLKMKYKILYLLIPLTPIEFIGMYIDYSYNSLLGYIPYFLISAIISLYIFKNKFKKSIFILVNRIIGIIISFGSVNFFMNVYHSSDYFNPFSTSGFSLFLGLISFITIAIIYLLIYGISSKNN